MIIYIDPGHSGVWPNGDPGVVSTDGKKIESHYTWRYANYLKCVLRNNGFMVELTRNQDEYKIPYDKRTSLAKKEDLLISLHFDTYMGGKKLIYYSSQGNSQDFAEDIDEFFGSGDIRKTQTSRFGRLYIDDAKCPAILIEVDRIDRATLDETVMDGFSQDVLYGINKYLGVRETPENNSGQIEGDSDITTSFRRVFVIDEHNNSRELPVERMSIVGDKLYIAPEKGWTIEEAE